MSRILSNAKALLFAEALNAAGGVVVVIVLSRALDAGALGLYSFSFAVGAVLGVGCLFGANQWIIRELAREPARAGRVFGDALRARLAAAALLCAAVAAFFAWENRGGERFLVILLLIVARLGDCFLLMACAYFRAFQEMEREAVLRTGAALCQILIGVPVLLVGRSMRAFALAQAGISLFFAALATVAAARRCGAAGPGSWAGARAFARDSARFSIMNILLVLHVQTNTVLLGMLKGDRETGIYTAGFRFVSVLGMAAMSISGAFFPALSKLRDDPEGFDRVYVKSIKALMIPSCLAGAFLFVFAPELIRLFYGAGFAPSAAGLRVMAFAPMFSFMGSGVFAALFAQDMERQALRSLVLSVSFVVAINLALLPFWGQMGAAVTTVLPEIFSLTLLTTFLRVRTAAARPWGLWARGLLLAAMSVLPTMFFSAWPAKAAVWIVSSLVSLPLLGLLSAEDRAYWRGRLMGMKTEAAAHG